MAPSDRLPPGQQLAALNKWPVVGERDPLVPDGPWAIEVVGCVDQPTRLTVEELRKLPQVERTVDIHCVTRWSKLAQTFAGVRLSDVLEAARPTPAARYVSFVAASPRDHSTSLVLSEAQECDVLLALCYQGQPLAREHGGPVRVVTPGRYFYKSLKWLTRIELLSQDRLGYWEAEAGYHNHADPWREERYIAARISKQEAALLIAERDFSGRDLMGIDSRGRDLAGLNAQGSLLRNADFRDANLQAANFQGANLSNARMQRADLKDAGFQGADIEGADLSGADLRGTDFWDASLFGVSLVDYETGLQALVDSTTRISAQQIEQLCPQQAAALRELLSPKHR